MKIRKTVLFIFIMIISISIIVTLIENDTTANNNGIVQVNFTDKQVTKECIDIHAKAQCLEGYEIIAMQVDEQPKIENVTELDFTATENRDYTVKVYYQSLTEQKELTETFTTTVESIISTNNDISLFVDSRTISENDFTIEIDEETQGASIRGYTGSVKELEIPETIKGYRVVDIGNAAFYDKSLTSVKIPNSVISIAETAFGYCKSLESVIIPSSVNTISMHAFIDCVSLKSIEIPDSVTSIGAYVFSGCKNLSTVKLSKSLFETGIGTFINCTSLERVVIPEGITTIGMNSFKGCINLESIELPKTVTKISIDAFKDCQKLKDINLENIQSFYRGSLINTALESIVIPKTQSILLLGNIPCSGSSFKFLAVPHIVAIKYKVYKSPQLNDIMIMCTDPNQYNLPDDAKILEIETTNLDVRWYRAVLTGDVYVKQNRIYSAYSKGRQIHLDSVFENKGIKEVLYQGKTGTELYTGDSVSIPQDYLELEEGTDISMKYQLMGNPTSSDTKIVDNKLYIGSDETSHDLKVTASILSTVKEVPISIVPIKSVVVKNIPLDTYIEGEVYNPKGLVLTVTYDDGYQEDVIYSDETKNDFQFVYNQLDLSNTKQIIGYKGKTAEHKLTILSRYIDIILKNSDTSVAITGKFTRGSYLIVEKKEKSQHLEITGKEVIGNYEVKVVGNYQGNLFIVFDVGNEYNGKKVYIRHYKQNGNIEYFEERVVGGNVGITVNELSPFVIYTDHIPTVIYPADGGETNEISIDDNIQINTIVDIKECTQSVNKHINAVESDDNTQLEYMMVFLLSGILILMIKKKKYI